MSAALNTVLETDAAAARAELAANLPVPRYLRTTVLTCLIVVGGWLFIAPPAWLLPAEPAVPERPVSARTLAVVMVSRADEVVTMYRDRGELPVTLAGFSPLGEEIHYRTTGPAAFELRVSLGDSALVLPVTIPRDGAPTYDLKQTAGLTP